MSLEIITIRGPSFSLWGQDVAEKRTFETVYDDMIEAHNSIEHRGGKIVVDFILKDQEYKDEFTRESTFVIVADIPSRLQLEA